MINASLVYTRFLLLLYRYQRTTAEAKILTTVQVELDKIDLLLSNDVIILRNKIEDANRAFELARFMSYSLSFKLYFLNTQSSIAKTNIFAYTSC